MVDFKKTPMTQDQAEFVRILRVDFGSSYRIVAGCVAAMCPQLKIKTHAESGWPEAGYQQDGMDLCSEAAEFFGENAGDELWN